MKERPILMRTHDVQALLAGRKTQSRLVAKPQPVFVDPVGVAYAHIHANTGDKPSVIIESPYKPGDILWVQETWADYNDGYSELNAHLKTEDPHFIYRADFIDIAPGAKGFWKPSIHMPKSAARIWLEVESVRVERLQDISEEDAVAEGIERVRAKVDEFANVIVGTEVYRNYPHPLISGLMDPRDSYRTLWKSIHGPESWDSNNWVWVIAYRILSTNGKP